MSPPREALLRILDEARSLVRQGWAQRGPAARLGGDGTLTDPSAPVARAWSPLGALMRALASHGHTWESPTAVRALRALRNGIAVDWHGLSEAQLQTEHQGLLCRLIADWNDAEDRQQRHAVLAFDLAIGLIAQSQKQPPNRKEHAA